jgi:hypothetical protein
MVPNSHAHFAAAYGRCDDALGGAVETPTAENMIPDIDIWRCAALMINNHGEEASMEAATMADDFLSKGNVEAQRVWLRIAKAIDELRTVKMGETKQ